MGRVTRHRELASSGGCARKTVSLPADMVERVEMFLSSEDGTAMTFSAFVSDALKARLDLFKIPKKKVR